MGKYDKRAKILLIIAAVFVILLLGLAVYKYASYITSKPTICVAPISTDTNYKDYDGQVIKGANVQALIYKAAESNVAMEVTTKKGDFWYYYTDETLSEKSDLDVTSSFNKNNENYINPSLSYIVSLIKNSGDDVVTVVFEEIED